MAWSPPTPYFSTFRCTPSPVSQRDFQVAYDGTENMTRQRKLKARQHEIEGKEYTAAGKNAKTVFLRVCCLRTAVQPPME